jgi:G patch domain-containing protein 1
VGVFEDPDEDAAAFFENDARDDVGHFYEIPASASESEPDSDADARFSARRDDGNLGNLRGGDEKKKKSSLQGSWCVRGFVVSKHTLAPTKWYPPPVVPRGFDGRHAFPDENAAPAPRDGGFDRTETAAAAVPSVAPPPPPPPPPPPSDASVKKFIDTTAHFVAKNGAWFEQMAREKQRADPRFAFLRDPASSSAARVLRVAAADVARGAVAKRRRRRRVGGATRDVRHIHHRRASPPAARGRDRAPRRSGKSLLPLRAEKKASTSPSVAAGDRTKIASALSGAFVAGAVEGSCSGGRRLE